ncbi:centrosomal P4.1-associated protein-like [Diadema setosum]|uniref:centrosomal P4.1-associated protein-like n=1 Tax=Diadema setosum TaxID=31175 RepID=UPI003B3AB418
MEQRGTQEQAKLLEKFRLLRQWQQQQQAQLMVQQQQQLEMLKNQQEMVQQALMQQRLRQWGGVQEKRSPPKSPGKKKSPVKSPVASPSQGSKRMPSSLPRALAQATAALSISQNTGPVLLEGIGSNIDQSAGANGHSQEEGTDLDSGSEHPGFLSLDGVYPLPDTASETSEMGTAEKENSHHGDTLGSDGEQNLDTDDEIFPSVSDQCMTPTSGSPRHVQHLSVHLPDSERTAESDLPLSPDRCPPSPSISPQLSPFSPTTPSHRGRGHGPVLEQGEDGDRPIQSQVGIEFKSFEELVDFQLKSTGGKVPPAASATTTTAEPTSATNRHAFLRRGQGIARFGMKPRKLKPRKTQASRQGQETSSGPGTERDGQRDKQKTGVGKTKKTKKDEPPKISRKVSSKAQQPPAEPHPADNIFKKPQSIPVPRPKASDSRDRDRVRARAPSSPVEREKIDSVALQHRLLVPGLQLSDGATSGHDDTLEVSFNRRIMVWEKKAEIEQEDLDEFEMLEKAADDNISFCSEASLVVNVLQRAQTRKQQLLGLSPHIKEADRLPTLVSMDASQEKDGHNTNAPESSQGLIRTDDQAMEEEQAVSSVQSRDNSSRPVETVYKETLQDHVFEDRLLGKGEAVVIRDDFYSSASDEEEEEEKEEEEEEDLEIYRTGISENRSNNNNVHLRVEGESDDHVTSNNDPSKSSAGAAEDGMASNGRVFQTKGITQEMEEEEDSSGTPRKGASPYPEDDRVAFEDEETWGDFSAQLSDSSDEDSIAAMAPNLKSTPVSKVNGSVSSMKRKKGTIAVEEQIHLSPPPTSELVARLFPKLKQQTPEQKKEVARQERALQALNERQVGDGSQARLLRDKLNQLEGEIERFRKENLLLAKLREEREKGLNSLKKEMEEFQRQKTEDLRRFQEFKEEETKKLKREKKLFEKHQKTMRSIPDKRDREEIELLKNQLSDLQVELKQRESRWNASTRRLRDRIEALETENGELREEVKLMEQRRLLAWRQEENKNKQNSHMQPPAIPKPRPPVRPPPHQIVEQTNNNNVNKRRPGNKDQFTARNGDVQHSVERRAQVPSESSDDGEYLQAFSPPGKDRTGQNESNIYESRILNARRSRSPPRRERPPLPTPHERTPPPTRTKPSSLSPSSPSTSRNTPLSNSPQARQHSSPSRHAQGGPHHTSPPRGVIKPQANGRMENYEEIVHTDGKVEQIKTDGTRVLAFANGTTKEISPDGRSIIISFFNGDMKQITPDQRVVYYYSETKTTHTTYPDGLEILQFSNNQTEKHYPDGTKEITFPDQTIKYLFPNGGEESVFADGTVLRVDASGQRVMEFPNGQREVHTDQYKRREYPDGTVKTVYPDGRQETRYSSGRLRIKDKDGNIMLDKKC